MFRVAAWKSAQGLASLTLNTEDDILKRTAHAIDAIRNWRNTDVLKERVDWDAWDDTVATAIGSKQANTGLLGLTGVRYPRATAFLAFLAPAAFPVIDKWTIEAVFGDAIYRTHGRWERSIAYTHFTRELVNNRKYFPGCATVHDIDQAVMEAAMKCERQHRHASRPCTCYPTKWPIHAPP